MRRRTLPRAGRSRRPAWLAEAAEFQTLAISRLTAQHAEIEQLREAVPANARVRSLPNAPTRIAPYGSSS